jgi:hypothetical protein
MYQTQHTFASNALAAGEAPSWVAAMLGPTSPEMLFSVYARFIPNGTRHDCSALPSRMTERANAETGDPAGGAVLPNDALQIRGAEGGIRSGPLSALLPTARILADSS